MANPYEKYLSKEDKMQRSVMTYINTQYPKAMAVHIPNEGKRSPFERFKLKALGVFAGMPDVMIFDPNANRSGLAIELKAGYNKPTENQKKALEALKMRNWATYWTNSFDEAKEIIDNYFNEK